jgi:hypothetical protein
MKKTTTIVEKMAPKPVSVSWMSVLLVYCTLVTVIECLPNSWYPPSLSSSVNSHALSSKSSLDSPHSSPSLGSTSDEVMFEAAFQGKFLLESTT